MASKLFDSRLASSHHYYIVFFEAKEVASINEIYKLFSVTKKKEDADLEVPELQFTHIQLELPGAYGSPLVLAGNMSRKIDNVQHYWYDFYLGAFMVKRKQVFFISYPYVRLGKYIESCLSSNRIRRTLYKPDISRVMEFMKIHEGNYYYEAEKLKADIKKYTAKVIDDKTNKIHISGGNPLNSDVFKILSKAKSIKIQPTSLKMNCLIKSRGEIDLSFDKLGNYRFWIPYNKELNSFSTIPSIYKFFVNEQLMLEDTFFNTYTLLEDDKD